MGLKVRVWMARAANLVKRVKKANGMKTANFVNLAVYWVVYWVSFYLDYIQTLLQKRNGASYLPMWLVLLPGDACL